MEFKNTRDLVNQVNSALGEFCNEFGRKRKELAGNSRLPKKGILFKYEDDKRNWVINEGGGTEVQYHLGFNRKELSINYGLGFNTQYVPFANSMTTTEYMKPFMEAFLKNKSRIKSILPEYDIVIGNIDLLTNPKHDEYVLFGKIINVEKLPRKYFLRDIVFEELIDDLRKQFEAYQIIFIEKNNLKKVEMDIREIIEVLRNKGQLILQGAPGTGKTYTAKDIAELMIFDQVSQDKKLQKQNLESSEQFKLIQFHSAYTYEDFVRGIVAESKGEFIEYKTKNKVFAEFAKLANTNFINSQKINSVYTKEKWIDTQFKLFVDSIEEKLENENKINLTDKISIFDLESDAFRYKGDEGWTKNGNRMLFSDIKKSFFDDNTTRQDIKKNSNLSGLAHHHASYYIRVLDLFKKFLKEKNIVYKEGNELKEDLKNYILIIDEINRANLPAVLGELIYALEYRGEKVESMYDLEENGTTLIIPPNLYIIGTMNTSDRSIGNIDYAIRRRFAFINMLPKILNPEIFQLELFKKVSELFIKNVNEYIIDDKTILINSEHLSEEFRAEDVWLGHSYFIKGNESFELRIQYEIIPILKEYVKDGILKQSADTIINSL